MITEEELEEMNAISGRVLGCAIKVAKVLRPGYFEKVYENALVYEMRKQGLSVETQVRLDVWYEDIVVGQFVADVVVEGMVLLELKMADAICNAHISQALNYLTTTGLPLCLILNFGTSKLGIKRVRL